MVEQNPLQTQDNLDQKRMARIMFEMLTQADVSSAYEVWICSFCGCVIIPGEVLLSRLDKHERTACPCCGEFGYQL